MNIQPINLDALNTAVTTFVGAERGQMIAELYALLDNAERRGYEAAQSEATGAYDAGYDAGYEDGHADGEADGDSEWEPVLPFEDEWHYDIYQGKAFNNGGRSYDIDMRSKLHGPVTEQEFYDSMKTAYADELND